MTVKQISVFLENKPGQLNELTKVLWEHQIDMRALSLADTRDFGIDKYEKLLYNYKTWRQ